MSGSAARGGRRTGRSYRWRVNQHEFERMVDEARLEATAYLSAGSG